MWGRWVGWFLAKVLWRTKVAGADRVPRKGAAILVANHVGFIDGPVAIGIVPRRTHFLVKEEMFVHVLGAILTGSGTIKVDESGREALARARQVLARGDAVGVFPEGTRGAGDAASVHGGAAWLAVQSGAPVVPVALFGTRHTGESVNVWPKPGRKIWVEFGEPFTLQLPDDLKGRARQSAAEHAVAEGLRAHLQDAATRSPLPLPTDDPARDRQEADTDS